ncbi:UMF1 family MFS transporter [Saccharopolyspora erythraea NRRL 2338]|uniref:Integral membrane protein n=2 Tax=Saccharopolyspora erythraea TaxID=1836 RepID=A4FC20_SACEN|nr:MFS transporter [Saccharopolyspora erythraea]EQD84634.1 MFS transporter [Saccharopolyspora erythraea D]PFG95365.1 UMF1 family MFS transporter [Saccharopolyspora erythraea NRRL 2338]QRK92008.1 MFS transporter [Saccharopolyspora erythraea]CAM01595.1 putative integral membrane protein [Saccharopolyspora erythraea NRRL 2338]
MSVMGSELAPDAARRRREQRGWCWYDWANSVFPTSVTTVFLSLYLTSVATEAARADIARNGVNACPGDNALQRCDISLLGLSFPAGSLWGYLLSVATVVQVLVLPITGAIADRTQNKRAMLATFAFGGALATALLSLVAGSNWQFGVAMFIAANICFGASVVVYYSFLPEIADADERDQLSSRGWAFGYLGGGLALGLHLMLYLGHDAIGLSTETAVRLVFVSSGVWWAAFTLLPLAALRRHRRPEGAERGASVVTAGFKQLASTVKGARHFPLTLGFLGAYMIYTDGIATVANVSAQYGSLELKLPQDSLITTLLIVQFIAFVGGVLHGRAARRFGAKKTIMVSLVCWVLVLGAAYFVQAGQALQFYGLAVGIGLVLGGTNALSRSLFSQMVPEGKEAEYFSLYEVGERSTSWLGPLLFAGVGQATGSFRLAIISLVVFFAIGLVLIALVPVRRAIEAVGNRPPAVL